MASTDKPDTEAGKLGEAPPAAVTLVDNFMVPVVLRVLLFITTLVALVVMVTSKQTKTLAVPGLPYTQRRDAKFNHSPAFIYFVAAMCVVCLYSIITTLASLSLISKPQFSKIFFLNFALLDVLFLGIVASATGTAGSVAYIGLRGNSHSRWGKICNVFDKYCRHIGASVVVSLLAAILLMFLSMLSTFSLYQRVRD